MSNGSQGKVICKAVAMRSSQGAVACFSKLPKKAGTRKPASIWSKSARLTTSHDQRLTLRRQSPISISRSDDRETNRKGFKMKIVSRPELFTVVAGYDFLAATEAAQDAACRKNADGTYSSRDI